MPEHGCREPRSKGNAGEIAWCQTVRSHVTHNAGWDVRRCASCFRPTDPPLVHVPRPAGWDGIAMCVCAHPHPSNHLSHAGVYRPAGSPAAFVANSANKACPELGAFGHTDWIPVFRIATQDQQLNYLHGWYPDLQRADARVMSQRGGQGCRRSSHGMKRWPAGFGA